MTDTTDAVEEDRALKARHRAMWASGDYLSIVAEIIASLGPKLVEAAGITAGDRVLDVAAGSGNASIPAALAGASVVASDLTPELLEAGQRAAAEKGATLDWREADAESLPFSDDEFDTVISCVGVMFAPRHRRSADEMLRVCRPGGTIALINWTPAGFIGQVIATLRPYAAPPPPGAQPPPLWGDEAHVRELFGDRVTEFTAEKHTLEVTRFGSGEEVRDYFKQRYGPTIAVYRNIGADLDRTASLDRELVDVATRFARSPDDFTMEWEYLLVTARVA